MHIGFCENCRYIDLIENMAYGCPRCGNSLTPMGISSNEWNEMSEEERDEKIREKFPTHEDLWGPRVSAAPEPEESDQTNEEEGIRDAEEPWVIEEVVKKTEDETSDTWDVEEAVEEAEEDIADVPEIELAPIPEQLAESIKQEAAEPEPEPEPEPVQAVLSVQQPESEAGSESETETEPLSDDEEYVYVCYKCNSIAGHDRSHDRYYCTDCGSDMVNVGYTVRQWADLSKEEKRKVSENAKIVHMVREIKRDNYEESEADHTPSIIKVVKNPDSDYG